ncbi:hypothetical protein KJ903_03740 [Patescibacteria group bacterium]|nr:hypothetical protein [Patescibacteria group bacterium]
MSDVAAAALYDEFCQVMQAGDEAKAKDFLVENYDKLPEKVQGEVALLLFEEGLGKLINDKDQKVAEFQERGLKVAQELENAKKQLEDKLKAMDVEESINASDK